jgi:hypothetical protein
MVRAIIQGFQRKNPHARGAFETLVMAELLAQEKRMARPSQGLQEIKRQRAV